MLLGRVLRWWVGGGSKWVLLSAAKQAAPDPAGLLTIFARSSPLPPLPCSGRGGCTCRKARHQARRQEAGAGKACYQACRGRCCSAPCPKGQGQGPRQQAQGCKACGRRGRR